MRSRGLVVALAVLLAVAAAGAVVLYTNGVKKAAESGGSLTTVIVATQDIPANTSLDPLIQGGGFKELSVPTDAVVDGAVTSLASLQGQTTTAPIVANEQLTASNLSSGEQVAGGMLGISKGHLALTIKLNAPQGSERQHPARGQHHRLRDVHRGLHRHRHDASAVVERNGADDRQAGAPGLHGLVDPYRARAAGREPRAR